MKKLSIMLMLLSLLACSKAPITGRSQILIVPKYQVLQQSGLQYEEVKKESKIINNSDSEKVKKVGKNIALAVETFLRSDPQYAGMVDDYNWEFNLIDSEDVNAWCMPGGKVAVYTGIMPYAKDEEGLAVIMGHEIAHAVADHGRERMSQELIKSYGAATLSSLFDKNPTLAKSVFSQAYGVSSNLVTLKYSRDHEKEADRLGLIFMKMAGYDPSEAVGFWERMAADKEAEPLEFFSTHPNNATRIQLIKEFIGSTEFSKY
jgi:predicted Zn-dependent protease